MVEVDIIEMLDVIGFSPIVYPNGEVWMVFVNGDSTYSIPPFISKYFLIGRSFYDDYSIFLKKNFGRFLIPYNRDRVLVEIGI